MEHELPVTADPKRPWFEPVTVILMAAASLSTAWCSYQSSLWSGESSSLSTHADKLERKAVAQHLEARQIESMHSRMWMEAMDAQLDGDEKLARFYTERFTDELKPAWDKWMALKPLENPAAPPHPFVPELYELPFTEEIEAANAEAAREEIRANTAGHTAGSYLSNTVILATVLFFTGTAGRFDRRHVRWFSLIFAGTLFIYAAVRMLMLPVM